jgi:hypothetical protein
MFFKNTVLHTDFSPRSLDFYNSIQPKKGLAEDEMVMDYFQYYWFENSKKYKGELYQFHSEHTDFKGRVFWKVKDSKGRIFAVKPIEKYRFKKVIKKDQAF